MIPKKPSPNILLLSFLGIASAQTQPEFAGIAWWGWLIILLLVILLVWWLITRQVKPGPSTDEPASPHASEHTAEDTGSAEMAPMHPAGPINMVVEAPQPMPVNLETEQVRAQAVTPTAAPDNLEIIEGIGPKIASLLQANGIVTFSQLSATDPAHLRQILDTAGLRISDPTTWPEQARLAANGDWEGLKVLQSALKGGRRNEQPGNL